MQRELGAGGGVQMFVGEPLSIQGAQILSGWVHFAVLAALALSSAHLPADEPDAESIEDRIALMRALLNAGAERERVRIEPPDVGIDPADGQGGDGRRGGGTGTRAVGEEGSPGSSVSKARGGHVSILGPAPSPAVSRPRDAALREAASFGMIGSLAALNTAGFSTTPWRAESTEGTSTSTTLAPLWGGLLEDSFAWGGLGLTGTGEGGGGRAQAIGLGSIGALGRGAGTGTNASFGPGDGLGGAGEGAGGRGEGIAIGDFGALGHDGSHGYGGSGGSGWFGGRHAIRAGVWGCDETLVNGRLPPEVIQRIVRQNMGRFRYCYQRALDGNPGLQGRVVTRFLIARDGSVGFSAQDERETDFPDPGVVSCIVRAFGALSFPEPEGGTVTVVYPLALAPSG